MKDFKQKCVEKGLQSEIKKRQLKPIPGLIKSFTRCYSLNSQGSHSCAFPPPAALSSFFPPYFNFISFI